MRVNNLNHCTNPTHYVLFLCISNWFYVSYTHACLCSIIRRLFLWLRLLYQQDVLLRKIDEMISTFDSELRCLYFDKLKLDVDLKNADLRYITLFEEFLLLKEYEKHENILGNKLAVKQQEKIDQQTKVGWGSWPFV